ncbi:hypothetical protein [Serpens gallinarum]|jgi:hypothetical protein|uniref:MFS transporter n=1 Tax=Serpens gallinarum TaxID=2763075 RepID=A0ABR8TJL3_9PSED|nr:hypothetical protein [Serpens gallinarum]MBD7975951.1 hypothetical protein [Serpens gallinarum]
MQAEGFFEGLGEVLGTILRVLIDSLYGVFAWLAGAGASFLNGLSKALGMDPSLLSLVAVAIGLLVLISAFRALFRRALISGVLLLLLALWLFSLVIH